MLSSLRLSNLTRRLSIHPLRLCTSVLHTGDTGGRCGSQLGGTHGLSGSYVYQNSISFPVLCSSSSMCSGGWVNEPLVGLQPFFGPFSLGIISPKELMEGRLVCKYGFSLSRLTVSLGYPGTWAAGPQNKHQQPQEDLPSPHHPQLRKDFVNLEVRWGGHASCHFSCVWFSVTLWTVACQAPVSMGFSRQEYWSGLPCPAPGHPPDPGMEPASLVSPARAGSLPWAPPGRGAEPNRRFAWGVMDGSQGPRILERVHVCLTCIAHVCVWQGFATCLWFSKAWEQLLSIPSKGVTPIFRKGLPQGLTVSLFFCFVLFCFFYRESYLTWSLSPSGGVGISSTKRFEKLRFLSFRKEFGPGRTASKWDRQGPHLSPTDSEPGARACPRPQSRTGQGLRPYFVDKVIHCTRSNEKSFDHSQEKSER